MRVAQKRWDTTALAQIRLGVTAARLLSVTITQEQYDFLKSNPKMGRLFLKAYHRTQVKEAGRLFREAEIRAEHGDLIDGVIDTVSEDIANSMRRALRGEAEK